MDKKLTKISKFMSLVLRHKPETISLVLNEAGWGSVEKLLRGCNITLQELEYIVENDNKKRYEFNSDKKLIRASQGHSINVDLGYSSKTPPEILYHGTVERNSDSILRNGLNKMGRIHVHLSSDQKTAINVGSRRGKPVIFEVSALKMYHDGHIFYISTNGVWLTEKVPKEYLYVKETK